MKAACLQRVTKHIIRARPK